MDSNRILGYDPQMHKTFLLLFAVIVLNGSCAASSEVVVHEKSWAKGTTSDLGFETSSFMKETVYAKPDSLSNDATSSGAYGPFNRDFESGGGKDWFIESQRFGVDAIGAGLAWDRKDLIDKGLHILDWGFAHQNADGSFSCPDAFHSTAFFVEAAARTALLLEASGFKSEYKAWVEKVRPKILAAAKWMARAPIFEKGLRGDSIYTHRYYLNADALAFAGLLGSDPALINISKKLIEQGMAKQNPSGSNPEKGGFDTSYHAVGMVFALRYYDFAADEVLRSEMQPMITRALGWLKGRVNEDGSFNQTGNTRTGDGQEIGRDKKAKTMSWGSAARAFANWSQISGDSSFERLAVRVFQYGQSHRKP